MTKYEELIAEYEEEMLIQERAMKNDGLYSDGVAWINRGLPTASKHCILAEEIGHYTTSIGNILNQDDIANQKQELAARRWAYNKILPPELIQFAFSDGHTEIWDMAEYLDVDEEFLRDALKDYGIL